MDKRKLTQQYIAAFDAKELGAVAAMLDDAVVLTDPGNAKGISGTVAVVDMIQGLFDQTATLNFNARHIFIDGECSLIEFTLQLDDTYLQGVDVIEWNAVGQITALRAYLY